MNRKRFSSMFNPNIWTYKSEPVKPLSAVPYQKCPVCEGKGTIFIENYNHDRTDIGGEERCCQTCEGKGIIPMHIVTIDNSK